MSKHKEFPSPSSSPTTKRLKTRTSSSNEEKTPFEYLVGRNVTWDPMFFLIIKETPRKIIMKQVRRNHQYMPTNTFFNKDEEARATKRDDGTIVWTGIQLERWTPTWSEEEFKRHESYKSENIQKRVDETQKAQQTQQQEKIHCVVKLCISPDPEGYRIYDECKGTDRPVVFFNTSTTDDLVQIIYQDYCKDKDDSDIYDGYQPDNEICLHNNMSPPEILQRIKTNLLNKKGVTTPYYRYYVY